jgi:hypothetical protein
MTSLWVNSHACSSIHTPGCYAPSVYSSPLRNEFPFSFSTVMSDLIIESLCKCHGCVNCHRRPLIFTISMAGWAPYFSRVNMIHVIANVPLFR